MLKLLSICAVLLALATGSANAQQRAFVQKLEVPGAGFDLLIATPKAPGGPNNSFGASPDALIIHLVGGELAVEFDDPDEMVRAIDSFRQPIGGFRVESPGRQLQIPVAIYVVSKGNRSF